MSWASLALAAAVLSAPVPLPKHVHSVFAAELEGAEIQNVVVILDAPRRVFVYRFEDGRLVPRFLGSGFNTMEIEHVAPAETPGKLAIEVRKKSDRSLRKLTCAFEEFALACREEDS